MLNKECVLKAEQIRDSGWKKNYQSKQSVWLDYDSKKSNLHSLKWSGAVDEPLCLGWIDGTTKRKLYRFAISKPFIC